MFSAFMAYIEPGDEVILFEPFFDQWEVPAGSTYTILINKIRYISNIEIPGGVIRYVPLQPPEHGATKKSTSADWTLDLKELEKAFSSKTRMIVSLMIAACRYR